MSPSPSAAESRSTTGSTSATAPFTPSASGTLALFGACSNVPLGGVLRLTGYGNASSTAIIPWGPASLQLPPNLHTAVWSECPTDATTAAPTGSHVVQISIPDVLPLGGRLTIGTCTGATQQIDTVLAAAYFDGCNVTSPSLVGGTCLARVDDSAAADCAIDGRDSVLILPSVQRRMVFAIVGPYSANSLGVNPQYQLTARYDPPASASPTVIQTPIQTPSASSSPGIAGSCSGLPLVGALRVTGYGPSNATTSSVIRWGPAQVPPTTHAGMWGSCPTDITTVASIASQMVQVSIADGLPLGGRLTLTTCTPSYQQIDSVLAAGYLSGCNATVPSINGYACVDRNDDMGSACAFGGLASQVAIPSLQRRVVFAAIGPLSQVDVSAAIPPQYQLIVQYDPAVSPSVSPSNSATNSPTRPPGTASATSTLSVTASASITASASPSPPVYGLCTWLPLAGQVNLALPAAGGLTNNVSAETSLIGFAAAKAPASIQDTLWSGCGQNGRPTQVIQVSLAEGLPLGGYLTLSTCSRALNFDSVMSISYVDRCDSAAATCEAFNDDAPSCTFSGLASRLVFPVQRRTIFAAIGHYSRLAGTNEQYTLSAVYQLPPSPSPSPSIGTSPSASFTPGERLKASKILNFW